MRLVLAFTLLCGVAWGGEIRSIPSPQKTSADAGLEFVAERMYVDFADDLIIKGTVTKTSSKTYKFVRVILTVRDDQGAFINRDDFRTNPNTINPGEVGYMSAFIGMHGEQPATVEYTVTGQ